MTVKVRLVFMNVLGTSCSFTVMSFIAARGARVLVLGMRFRASTVIKRESKRQQKKRKNYVFQVERHALERVPANTVARPDNGEKATTLDSTGQASIP